MITNPATLPSCKLENHTTVSDAAAGDGSGRLIRRLAGRGRCTDFFVLSVAGCRGRAGRGFAVSQPAADAER